MLQQLDLFETTLNASYTAGGTTLSLASVTGLPASGDYWLAVYDPGNSASTYEVFKATSGASGSVVTVVGGQANSTNKSHASGQSVYGGVLCGPALTQLKADAGGAVTTPTVRASNIQVSSNSSYTVTWPTGTLAGDTVIICVGHAWVPNVPNGWKQVDVNTGSQWNGAAYSRILSAADITAGSVAVTFSGSFNGVVVAVSFVGIRTVISSNSKQNGTGLSTVTVNSDGAPVTTDYMLYFGSNRAGATSTTSVSLGSSLQASNDTVASGCLYGGSPASNGGVSPVFSYSTPGVGNYQIAIGVR